jgi:hypothetical protein
MLALEQVFPADPAANQRFRSAIPAASEKLAA